MRIVEGEVLRIGYPEFDETCYAFLTRPFVRQSDHVLTQVYADHTAAVFFGQVAGRRAHAAADIQNICVLVDVAQLDDLLRGLESPHVLRSANVGLQFKVGKLWIRHPVPPLLHSM